MKISSVNIYNPNNQNKIYKRQNNTNVAFTSDIGDTYNFTSLLASNILDVLDYNVQEYVIGGILDYFITPQCMTYFKKQKNTDLRQLFYNYLKFEGKLNVKYFEDAGIDNASKLVGFLNAYKSRPEAKRIFKGQHIEALNIYGLLDNKEDFAKFGDVLLHLYNQEKYSENPDFSSLNETTKFLKEIGLCTFSDFDTKYSYLKDAFNNFEDISDKLEAVNFLKYIHDDKMAKIDELLSSGFQKNYKTAQSLYTSFNDYIDCIYLCNNGNLEEFKELFDDILSFSKFKNRELNLYTPFFGDLSYVENKINFLEFLKENNVSARELSAFASKSITDDNDTAVKEILFKEPIVDFIGETKHINKQEAFETFKKYPDILTSLYSSDEDTESISDFLNLADKYKINNSQAFVSFYQKIYNKKIKTLNRENILEFLELFKYNACDIFKDAKTRNVSPLELLNEQKQEFLSVKDEIEKFVLNDETNYFAGLSALEIYIKYKELFQNAKNTAQVLERITKLNIETPEQYQFKANLIDKFSKFFENKEQLYNFFKTNNIDFSSEKSDLDYQQNCYLLLEALYDENDKAKSKERIDYFAENKIPAKSKADLEEFISQTQNADVRRSILSLMAEKKVPSFKAFKEFFEKYSESKESAKNVYAYLSASPVDFKMLNSILNKIQEKIDSLNIPVKINSSNIGFINPLEHDDKKPVETKDVLNLLKQTYQDKNGNFIKYLPNNQKQDFVCYPDFAIAYELASKMNKSAESYQNIARLLKIDKTSLDLPQDCSEYIHASAIRRMLNSDLIDLINSSDIINFDKSKNIPNVTLHARLRILDRYILNDIKDVSLLYSKETKEKLREIYKIIYTQTPKNVVPNCDDKRMLVEYDNSIKAIFSKEGTMITALPQSI